MRNPSASMSDCTTTKASEISSRVNSPLHAWSFCPMLEPTIGIQPAASADYDRNDDLKIFITIPTTPWGFRYCSCENTASNAPYLRSILLIAAIAARHDLREKAGNTKGKHPSEYIGRKCIVTGFRLDDSHVQQIPDGENCCYHPDRSLWL